MKHSNQREKYIYFDIFARVTILSAYFSLVLLLFFFTFSLFFNVLKYTSVALHTLTTGYVCKSVPIHDTALMYANQCHLLSFSPIHYFTLSVSQG